MALAALLFAGEALAQSRTAFLSNRLAHPPSAGQPDDFRVRTNAALALGVSNDDAAVPPLCRALSDPSEVVRQAVVAALKRLGRGSALGCLRGRLAVESNPGVQAHIARAIDAIAPAAPVDNGANDTEDGFATVQAAKFYVAIAHVSNHTGRPQGDVERLVASSIRARLSTMGGYRIAPPDESPSAARVQVGKRSLKGYYLVVSVDPFEYSDIGLRARVKVAVFSYPGKDLRGEVPASAVQTGVRPGDTAAEDNLLAVLARRSAELFAQNFR